MKMEWNIEKLWQLRQQISLNSLYVADYENGFGVTAKSACDFFDGFMSFISEMLYEDHPNTSDKEYWDLIWGYDNIESLERWWNCFDYDPFEYEPEDE